MTEVEAAVEAAYGAHASRILAALVRLFGTRNLPLAEDVLQEAFRKALGAWEVEGVPENPAAWIMAAAKNHAIDAMRGQRTQQRFSDDLAHYLESGWTRAYTVEQEFADSRIKDHQLRMIFMCTGADLPPENRIPLILRTLCGFSVAAICRALFLPEATVKKRLLRTRERLEGHTFAFPSTGELPHAMDTVHTVIYLLFNEGFHSTDDAAGAAPINLDLCRQAVHLARADARLDADGNPVPLDRQDRARWDRVAIASAGGLLRIAENAPPGASGRFLIEARIAEQHCLAPTFAATNWQAIAALYDRLVAATDSPIADLHRAVAVAYAGDPRGAIARVERLREGGVLRNSHLPPAVLAHLSALLGDAEAARRFAAESISLGGTPHEQRSMVEQIDRLLADAR